MRAARIDLPGSRPRDEAAPLDIEAQQAPRPMTCVIDADSRPPGDLEWQRVARRQEQRVADEIDTILAPIDVQGAAEETWSLRTAFDVRNGLHGAQQHRGGAAVRFHHDVHAVVNAVNEIDIGVAGWPEHHLGARRAAAGGMCRQIMRPEICLDLDDTPDAYDATRAVHDVLAEQRMRDRDCVAVVEGSR